MGKAQNGNKAEIQAVVDCVYERFVSALKERRLSLLALTQSLCSDFLKREIDPLCELFSALNQSVPAPRLREEKEPDVADAEFLLREAADELKGLLEQLNREGFVADYKPQTVEIKGRCVELTTGEKRERFRYDSLDRLLSRRRDSLDFVNIDLLKKIFFAAKVFNTNLGLLPERSVENKKFDLNVSALDTAKERLLSQITEKSKIPSESEVETEFASALAVFTPQFKNSDIDSNKQKNAGGTFGSAAFFIAQYKELICSIDKENETIKSTANQFIYAKAMRAYHQGKTKTASELFAEIQGYRDAADMRDKCQNKIKHREKRKKALVGFFPKVFGAIGDFFEFNAAGEVIETILQIVIYVSPLAFGVVSLVILAKNEEKITIIYGDSRYASLCGGTGFYTVIIAFAVFCLMIYRFSNFTHEEAPSRIMALVTAVLVAVGSIFVGVKVGKLPSHFYPPEFVSITALDKKASKTTNGFGSTREYISELHFQIVNVNQYEIASIKCEFTIDCGSAGNETVEVSISGPFYPGTEKQMKMTLTETNHSTVYDTPYSDLRISYRVVEMRFSNDYSTRDYDPPVVVMPKAAAAP